MANAFDKFARLTALRAIDGIRRPPSTSIDTYFDREARPPTEEECLLARTIGATVRETKFGCHLTVRNWHSTPAFCEPSAGVIELLEKAVAPAKPRPAAGRGSEKRGRTQDPENWLFLDTETTGISGGTGTYAFLIGVAWWEAGGLATEQFLLIEGVLQNQDGVISVKAARVSPLKITRSQTISHDFH